MTKQHLLLCTTCSTSSPIDWLRLRQPHRMSMPIDFIFTSRYCASWGISMMPISYWTVMWAGTYARPVSSAMRFGAKYFVWRGYTRKKESKRNVGSSTKSECSFYNPLHLHRSIQTSTEIGTGLNSFQSLMQLSRTSILHPRLMSLRRPNVPPMWPELGSSSPV